MCAKSKYDIDGIPRDKDIRLSFIKRNINFFKQSNCITVNEYGIGHNICDLALFDFNNNILYGFEIKSAKDNLLRIKKQLATYSKFFNIIYVICAENHVNELNKFMSDKNHCNKIGVIKVDNNLNFIEIKKATFNKSTFDTLINNLNKGELELLYESKGGNIQTYTSKSNLIGKLKLKVNQDDLMMSLRNKLNMYYVKTCEKCGSNIHYRKVVGGYSHSYCCECNSVILDY